MPDPIKPVEAEDEEVTPDAPAEPEAGDSPIEGEEALGDPGKRALEAIKAKHRAERAKRIELEEKLRDATAPKGDELDPEAIRDQIRREVRAEADREIIAARVEATAAKFLHNPADAVAFIDLSEFQLENGKVDADEIQSAIKDLIAERPYLAITGTPQRGSTKRVPEVPADPANKPSTPVSHAERIKAAQAAGDIEAVIALQNDLLTPQ